MCSLIKSLAISLSLTAIIITVALFTLGHIWHVVQLQEVSSAALIMGITGTVLAFAGSNFVADASGRYGAHDTPQYIWGNRIQTIGFTLTIVALLIK